MSRGVVLTLAATMALAGLTGSRADELPLLGWPALWPAAPAVTEIFPRMPENWGDLPLQFHLSEQAGYNSNITNTPTGPGANSGNYGRPIGAMESISTYGVSFKNEIGAHQFFGDASWGVYRYLDHANFNIAHRAVDIGDNFTYGSKCNGSLKFSDISAPALPGQQIGYNVINTLTTVSATENLKCLINGEYSGIFNSGLSKSTNSATLDAVNNYQSAFIAAGISYAVSETNSLQLLATITGTDYTDRGTALNTAGLNNNITTDQVMATYTKNFGPNLSLNAQFGVVGVTNSYFEFGLPRSILPQYSLSLQWAITPKLALTVSASRLVSPPTSLLSNLQVTENATAGLSYQWTPKITLSGNLTAGYATGVATPIVTQGLYSYYTSNQKTYGGTATLNYAITPFLAASLSYQVTKTVQASLTTNDSLVLMALNFNPY
ncbi:hypothetical protein DFR50_12256 [Roseiarcus fermentans]|uniref:Uncharacterized protein n=1 Tax=Roseiarcus fermentans TaxID=1473586 RepID=A0A366F627_9HYPH|nr:hypothetical protein [Roseiarcus fermentans]RBP09219.1 hypothetical protein DFR50_12256 [Roseiarcus fermentans]